MANIPFYSSQWNGLAMDIAVVYFADDDVEGLRFYNLVGSVKLHCQNLRYSQSRDDGICFTGLERKEAIVELAMPAGDRSCP